MFRSHVACAKKKFLFVPLLFLKNQICVVVSVRYAPCNTLLFLPIPSAERMKRASLRDFVFVSSSLGTKAIALSFAIADQRPQQFEFLRCCCFVLILLLLSYRFPYLRCSPLLFALSTRSGPKHRQELAFVPVLGSI